MKLAVVIPYYNGEAYIKRCVSSLGDYPAAYVFLVDNSDERKPIDLPVQYIDAEKSKLGFAKTVNIGLRIIYQKDFTHVLVLNQDAYFQQGHFQQLITYLQQHHLIAFASPMVYTSDFSLIMPFLQARYFPTIPVKPIEIADFVAVALVAHLDMMKRLDGFDESYFMYYEDNDLIARSGLKNPVKILPQIHVGHENPDLESTAINKEKDKWIRESRLKYLKNHGSKKTYWIAWMKNQIQKLSILRNFVA